MSESMCHCVKRKECISDSKLEQSWASDCKTIIWGTLALNRITSHLYQNLIVWLRDGILLQSYYWDSLDLTWECLSPHFFSRFAKVIQPPLSARIELQQREGGTNIALENWNVALQYGAQNMNILFYKFWACACTDLYKKIFVCHLLSYKLKFWIF